MRSRRGVVVLCLVALFLGAGWLLLRRGSGGSGAGAGGATAGKTGGPGGHAPAGPGGASAPGGARGGGDEAKGARPLPAWFAQQGAPARRVAGRVVEGGQPVAGATVQLGAGMLVQSGRASSAIATTGADGKFDFGLQAAGRYAVTASAKGKTPALAMIDVRDPRARPPVDQLELQLGPCDASLSGVVRDSSGGTIEHARVRPFQVPWLAVETDGEGKYEMCLKRGFANVVVSADGYGGVSFDLDISGRARLDVILVPEATVSGKVVRAEDGTGVADANVGLWFAGGGGRERPAGGIAVSDEQGNFRIAGLTAGRYFAWASTVDLASSKPIEVNTEVGKSTEGVVIRIDAMSLVAGRVMQNGQPVVGVKVRTEMKQTSRGSVESVTQDDGSFILAPLPRGETIFIVTGYEVESPKSLVVSQPEHRDVKIEVASMAAIRGRVLRHGQPVARAEVRCAGGGGMRFEPLLSDRDGRYECTGLSLGDFQVFAVDSDGEAFAEAVKVTLKRGEVKENVDIELKYSATVAGVVVDQDGKPVEGVYVRMVHPEDQDQGQARTDSGGHFKVTALSGGGDYVPAVLATEASGNSYEPVEPFAKVSVPGGESHIEGVRLAIKHETLSISGRVVDGAGQPLPDMRVLAERQDARQPIQFASWRPLPAGRSDVDGKFVIDGLTRGDHGLLARAPDGAEARAQAPAGARDVLLTVSAASRLEGTLVGFTAPPWVYAHVIGGDGRFTPAQVTADGFLISGLAPGRYVVTAQSTTEGDAVEAELKAGVVTRLELKNHGTARVTGRILDRASKAPVPAMRCHVVMRAGELWGITNWGDGASSTETDEKGVFELEGVPAGDVLVQCFPGAPGRSSAQAATTLAAGQRFEVEMVSLARAGDRNAKSMGDIGGLLDARLVVPRFAALTPGGPAAKAGLQPGDLVTAVDAVPVGALSPDAVTMLMADHDPGTQVAVTFQRGAATQKAVLKVEAPAVR